MKDGDTITFFHAGGVAEGIVNGPADEHCVPVYMPNEDRQLYVVLSNVCGVVR